MSGGREGDEHKPVPNLLSHADLVALQRDQQAEYEARRDYKPTPSVTQGEVTYRDTAGIVITLTGEIPSSALRHAADFLQNLA